MTNEILHNIWSGLAEASPLDRLNLALGVSGVWLMTRRSLWAFPVGLMAVTAQGVLFWRTKFYTDSALQVFFFTCLAYGWWHWTKHKGAAPELPVTRLAWRTRLIGLAGAGVLTVAWGRWLGANTDAPMPYRDAFIAAFSVLGQVWQVRKRVENWPVWALVNLVAVVSYWSATLAFTSFLYGVYLVLGLLGWIEWAKALRQARCAMQGVES
jgi:nicotinamide mononucleotide transporter